MVSKHRLGPTDRSSRSPRLFLGTDLPFDSAFASLSFSSFFSSFEDLNRALRRRFAIISTLMHPDNRKRPGRLASDSREVGPRPGARGRVVACRYDAGRSLVRPCCPFVGLGYSRDVATCATRWLGRSNRGWDSADDPSRGGCLVRYGWFGGSDGIG